MFSKLISAVILVCAITTALSAQTVGIAVDSAQAAPGDTVCIPVRVNGFSEVLAFQWSITWNPSVAQLVDFTSPTLPGFSPANIGYHLDRVTISWNLQLGNPPVLPDGSVLFFLCLRAVGNNGTSTPLNINSQGLTVGEIFLGGTSNNLWPSATRTPGLLTIGTSAVTEPSTIALLAWPNPTHDALFFDQKNVDWQQVQVFDALGRLVAQPDVTDAASGLDVSACSPGWHTLVLYDQAGRRSVVRFFKTM
jgi:hypothetical protein